MSAKLLHGVAGWLRFGWAVAGSPIEIVRRALRWPWIAQSQFVWRDELTGRTITSQDGDVYDRFSFAPNLRRPGGKPSNADRIHDQAWESGRWDSGEWISFDDANRLFMDILTSEGHPSTVVSTYH